MPTIVRPLFEFAYNTAYSCVWSFSLSCDITVTKHD